MQSSTSSFPVQMDTHDVASLYASLATIPDQRHRRGVRYALGPLLAIAIVAKLANQDHPQAIAEWAEAWKGELTLLLQLPYHRMPHVTTWVRILGRAIHPAHLQEVLATFFTARLARTTTAGKRLLLAIDGKTLRGTIPLGTLHGVHLLAAYLPRYGIVLAQEAVGRKANELTHAPHLLSRLPLAQVIVTGDAMFTQRNLSQQILQAQGHYLWFVKENQATLQEQIATLFAPEQVLAGTSALPTDFTCATTTEKGHGRRERRHLTCSRLLAGYTDWPGAAQVFQMESQVTDATGHVRTMIRYGVTSLTHQEASAPDLLALARGHWGIENKLHYRRDVTFHEDQCQVRKGHAPEILASINNIVLGLLAGKGVKNVAKARRSYARRPISAFALLFA